MNEPLDLSGDDQAAVDRLEARITRLGQSLLDALSRLFPSEIGFNTSAPTRDPSPPLPDKYVQTVAALPAPVSGYLRRVDGERLIRLARQFDVVVHISQRPGRFLLKDAPMAHVHPASRANHEARQALQSAFILSPDRMKPEDAETIILQIVQMCSRALSPAVNDSLAAVSCIDWLGAGLRALTGLALPSPFRTDSEGVLCVVAPSTNFSRLAELSFAEIRHFALGNPTVTLRLFEQATELARFARRADDRRWLGRHIQAVQESSRHYPLSRADRERLERAWKTAAQAIGIDATSGPPPEGE